MKKEALVSAALLEQVKLFSKENDAIVYAKSIEEHDDVPMENRKYAPVLTFETTAMLDTTNDNKLPATANRTDIKVDFPSCLEFYGSTSILYQNQAQQAPLDRSSNGFRL